MIAVEEIRVHTRVRACFRQMFSVFFHWVVEKDETQGICWSARLVVVTGLESGKKNILPEFSGAGKCCVDMPLSI